MSKTAFPLPEDWRDAALVGRIDMGEGPTPIVVKEGRVFDVSATAPTVSPVRYFEWWARFALPTLRFLFLAADFFIAAFTGMRFFGRFFSAARCAAANAALAQCVNSSGSSNSRAGNCQYEFTVTVLARV